MDNVNKLQTYDELQRRHTPWFFNDALPMGEITEEGDAEIRAFENILFRGDNPDLAVIILLTAKEVFDAGWDVSEVELIAAKYTDDAFEATVTALAIDNWNESTKNAAYSVLGLEPTEQSIRDLFQFKTWANSNLMAAQEFWFNLGKCNAVYSVTKFCNKYISHPIDSPTIKGDLIRETTTFHAERIVRAFVRHDVLYVGQYTDPEPLK